jgi:predicted dehydrogenase
MTPLKLAMLGMVDGNGHPYSWSAIINGTFDGAEIRKTEYPAIADYLEAEPQANLGIPGAEVTHIWTDDPADARHVAKTIGISTVVDQPTDVIGEVDAVVIATDRGWEHVERAAPFVEAGLPMFIDKPLTDNQEDLRTFVEWVNGGARILSTSAMRYVVELEDYRLRSDGSVSDSRAELGELRYVSNTTMKSWERYGIHALEMVYPILGPGFATVRNTGTAERNIVHLTHETGVDCVLAAVSDMYGAFGRVFLAGTAASAYHPFHDTFSAFKRQLEGFIDYLRTGTRPVPFAETVELMKIIIAGIRSREQGGAVVRLDDIDVPPVHGGRSRRRR